MRDVRYSPTLHRIALLTAVATFPLIFMGGLVTSHGAGMSVPDWPNSYGYNMFTFPPSKWVGGIFYEHTHRLMGTVVGMCAIALTIAAWKMEPRRWARWLATSVLCAVILQGMLGGLRVVWVNLDLAIVHACFAQAFFCLAASVAIVTSRWWFEAADLSSSEASRSGRRLIGIAVACLFAVYLQLVIGAIMRHEKAGLAIPDLPLAYGKLLPPTNFKALAAINQQRAWTWQMDPVSMGQVWLHFGHRIGAIVVSIGVIALVIAVARDRNRRLGLTVPAIMLACLLLAQLTLGVLTVLMRKPADIASAHVAVGALVLVTNVVIALRAARLYLARGEQVVEFEIKSLASEPRHMREMIAA
jgi:cytochrome c oxidase assembly protein subunit 15